MKNHVSDIYESISKLRLSGTYVNKWSQIFCIFLGYQENVFPEIIYFDRKQTNIEWKIMNGNIFMFYF